MSSVDISGVSRCYSGTDRPAVDDLNLHIEDGEFLVLVGPSGCGKSTTLRMLAGLEEVDQGTIHMGASDVTNCPPRERDIAMVFQNYALYPHMTVRANLEFALKIARKSKSEIQESVAAAAEMMNIEPYLDRRPAALSGGQRQRVAMARALVRNPQVFLMDEPLSNLDAKLRVRTRTLIAQLQRRLNITTVYVTHDQVEAMTMGDRVAVMNEGVLQQCDTPRNIYAHPANVFVAGFLGSPRINLINATVVGSELVFGSQRIPVPAKVGERLPGSEVIVGVRPENLAIGDCGIEVQVGMIEETGADAWMIGFADFGGEQVDIIGRVDHRRPPAPGSAVYAGIAFPEEVHYFDAESGVSLLLD